MVVVGVMMMLMVVVEGEEGEGGRAREEMLEALRKGWNQ